MTDIQKGLFKTEDPEFDRMKSYARREAIERRRTSVHKDPVSGIPKAVVYDGKTLPDLVVSPKVPPDDKRKQAYRILTDEPIIMTRTGLLERLANAAAYTGMRVDFYAGEVRGIEFRDASSESMDSRVVRGTCGVHLPKYFAEARRVYDSVVKKLR